MLTAKSMIPFSRDFMRRMERAWEDSIEDFELETDFEETPTHYNLKIDMPGLRKDDIGIELYGNKLIVSGERKSQRKEEDKDTKTHFCEVSYGSYYRSFELPTPVNVEKVDAKYENGVLSLAVPKAAKSGAKLIAVR
ncbi:MAG: Hsp20/alpha crystallin family protein [Oligoflexia bacterium]|nr:Hsp20/alpha crystallin family protein [Oligoflexia bacterium]